MHFADQLMEPLEEENGENVIMHTARGTTTRRFQGESGKCRKRWRLLPGASPVLNAKKCNELLLRKMQRTSLKKTCNELFLRKECNELL